MAKGFYGGIENSERTLLAVDAPSDGAFVPFNRVHVKAVREV